MEGVGPWLARMRWRRRGAWMWPCFFALTIIDAQVGHSLPASGESQSMSDALLSAIVFNVIVVALLARPAGIVLRRVRRDLPKIVATDYAGTGLMLAIALALTIGGIAHRSTIEQHRRSLVDAVARAQAFIGARAPAEFRGNVSEADTVTIEPGLYRTCVPGVHGIRTYCVIVNSSLPFARSVKFDGYESNAVFAAGT